MDHLDSCHLFSYEPNDIRILSQLHTMLQYCLRIFYILIAVQVNKKAEKKIQHENDTPVTLDTWTCCVSPAHLRPKY